ncbi:MAG: outer membrane beta-barrel protein [Thioalkalispiraceae bacterium]
MAKLVTCLFLLVAFPVQAQLLASELYLGVSLLDFTYKEFDDDGGLLNREDGNIPGFVLGYKYQNRNLITDISFRYHGTDIRYDGQTQSGIPVTTISDADIYDTQLKIGAQQTTSSNYQYSLYGGVGYRLWERNIRSNSIASGIYEEYEWTYLMLGATFPIVKQATSQLDLDIRYTRMIDADIFVELMPIGFDNDVELALGQENGLRFSLPWRVSFENSFTWVIEPYYEFWEIGKSEIKPVYQDGLLYGYVWEPRSETSKTGANLKLVIPF